MLKIRESGVRAPFLLVDFKRRKKATFLLDFIAKDQM